MTLLLYSMPYQDSETVELWNTVRPDCRLRIGKAAWRETKRALHLAGVSLAQEDPNPFRLKGTYCRTASVEDRVALDAIVARKAKPAPVMLDADADADDARRIAAKERRAVKRLGHKAKAAT